MSSPQSIRPSRRQSIAKLTRSPMSSSPNVASSPSSRLVLVNQYNNMPFSKRVTEEVFSGSPSDEEDYVRNDKLKDSGSVALPEPVPDFSSGLDDPKMLETVSKHLGAGSLQHEGADMTWDLHKLGVQERVTRPRRSKSLSSQDYVRRGSTASSLNVPGGFRREYLLNSTEQSVASARKVQPSFLTRNFVEFLSIYGHFAGEDLEDDDNIACHYSAHHNKYMEDEEAAADSERTQLLGSSVNPHGTANDRKAYFLLLKAFVGTGVLFLPKSFSNGGLVFSIITLVFFGLLSYWCYYLLILTKTTTGVSSFSEIGNKLFGPWFQRLILFSIIISQLGFVSAYIVFTGENMRAVLASVFDFKNLSMLWMVAGQFVILVPLSFIRDITKLSLSSVLANLFIMVGLVVVVYFLLFEWLVTNSRHFGPGIEYAFNPEEFSLFIGVAIFAFEGIGLIIPIQESMIHPSHFPKVLAQVILTISMVFIFMGALGYLTYGDTIQTVLLLNLPQDSWLVIAIQFLYSLAILLSTPLQLFPAIRLVEAKLITKTGKRSSGIKWLKNIFRASFVLLTCIIALIGGQNLDKFISFVGCFACIPLVYMYPPILHIKSIEQEELETGQQTKRWLKAIDVALVGIGLTAMIYTTYCILFV